MSWDHFCASFLDNEQLDFALDISKVQLPVDYLPHFESKFALSLKHMAELEKGAIANPDENRMVGHYWLRQPDLAPQAELKKAIVETVEKIKAFTKSVQKGKIKGQGGSFKNILVVGIGGSALGPQFIDQALRPAKNGLDAFFVDNTDPDGIDRVMVDLKGQLDRTLVLVISKSGGTKETRNGMLEVQAVYKKAKLDFAKHAVAVTGDGSQLFETAKKQSWLDIFPMWDWVGGRTSVMSAVGLLPAALSGFDIDGLLQGAAEMDEWTRAKSLTKNPAGLLSAMWYAIGQGKGLKDMVLLPYKDRLELFSKYLQQLVMESLGKELDLNGQKVNQGIAVYGNKGSTDQHAYVQQLRDGLNNFFVTFIEVKQSREKKSMEVDPGVTTGDYLEGFYLGTREALAESGRESISITVGTVSARSVGQLIALFERAVGFYAHYVGINAYHQPGVEAGKKAAQRILDLKQLCLDALKKSQKAEDALAVAKAIGQPEKAEVVFKLLNYLSANLDSGVVCDKRMAAKSKFKFEKTKK
jgi:glucose-6-phosphate isomerase